MTNIESENFGDDLTTPTIPGLSRMVEVRRSKRRKRSIGAHLEGETVVVSIPYWLSKREEREAVAEMLEKMKKHDLKNRINDEGLVEKARVLAKTYLDDRAVPDSIRWVSNMKERWGSCTDVDRSIRISDRLRHMPEYVLDYVILHELAHLIEIGHTKAFYQLEARYPEVERASAYLEGWQAGSTHDRG